MAIRLDLDGFADDISGAFLSLEVAWAWAEYRIEKMGYEMNDYATWRIGRRVCRKEDREEHGTVVEADPTISSCSEIPAGQATSSAASRGTYGRWIEFQTETLPNHATSCRIDMAFKMSREERYRQRAEELRTLCERIQNESARKTLFDVATEYEQLAESARLLAQPNRFASDS